MCPSVRRLCALHGNGVTTHEPWVLCCWLLLLHFYAVGSLSVVEAAFEQQPRTMTGLSLSRLLPRPRGVRV